MIDPVSPNLAAEEIDQFVHGNASAKPYLMSAYALECGRSPADAAAFAGRIFAPGWEETRGRGAFAVARLMALNVASCGADVTSLTGDERRAEIRATWTATADELAFFRLTREAADGFLGTFPVIAEHLGLRTAWCREGEEIVVTVDHPDDGVDKG